MRLFEGTPWDRPPRCERCQQLEADCQCPPESQTEPVVPPEKQTVILAVEKRKRGKTVTAIRGLAPQPRVLAELLTSLKGACGAGGAVKEDLLEIQGNHLTKIAEHLAQLGYRVKQR